MLLARLYPNFSDDWCSSSSKSERLHKASEKSSWNLNGVAFSGRHRKKGGGPEMLTNESERIGKGRQGFAIPGRLSNRKRLAIQQVMSKDGHERKECQQGRSGAQNSQIRPLALRLDSQMITHFMKGDFDRPAQDKPRDDLGSLCILIGAKQGHWLILALWIAHEPPPDRHRRDRRLIPQSRASGDFHLARGSPIPGQRVFVPLRRGIGEARSQLGLRFAFEGMAASFSGLPRWGRIVQTGIQAQAGDGAHAGQAAHFQQKLQQRATELSTRPGGTIEHAMIVLKLLFVRAAHHAQDGGNGSLSSRQDRSYHEHLCTYPHAFAKDRLNFTPQV